jgi:hypothetical protein
MAPHRVYEVDVAFEVVGKPETERGEVARRVVVIEGTSTARHSLR